MREFRKQQLREPHNNTWTYGLALVHVSKVLRAYTYSPVLLQLQKHRFSFSLSFPGVKNGGIAQKNVRNKGPNNLRKPRSFTV